MNFLRPISYFPTILPAQYCHQVIIQQVPVRQFQYKSCPAQTPFKIKIYVEKPEKVQYCASYIEQPSSEFIPYSPLSQLKQSQTSFTSNISSVSRVQRNKLYKIEIKKENAKAKKLERKIEEMDKKLVQTLKESRDFSRSFISSQSKKDEAF